jgi:heme/copper-type cytochrome/quinol oxidase subunit 3
MRLVRTTGDLATLPTIAFGRRSLMWWATLGFMTIEGWTTALLIASYLYLSRNVVTWPPLRTPVPALRVPTINLALMLVSFVPFAAAARAGKRFDLDRMRRWLIACCAISVPILILRWWELWALNTRWDSTAYGSAVWTIVGFHTSLLLLDIFDTFGLTFFVLVKRTPPKVFTDAGDNSFYWYFTVGSWAFIYLIVYVSPRVI